MRLTHDALSRRSSSDSSSPPSSPSTSASSIKAPDSSPTPELTLGSQENKPRLTLPTSKIIADEESNPFLSDDLSDGNDLMVPPHFDRSSEFMARTNEVNPTPLDHHATAHLDSIFPPITMAPSRASPTPSKQHTSSSSSFSSSSSPSSSSSSSDTLAQSSTEHERSNEGKSNEKKEEQGRVEMTEEIKWEEDVAQKTNKRESTTPEDSKTRQERDEPGNKDPSTPKATRTRPSSPPPLQIAHRPIIQRVLLPAEMPKSSPPPPPIFRPSSPNNPLESDAPFPPPPSLPAASSGSFSSPSARKSDPLFNHAELRFTFRGKRLHQGNGIWLNQPDTPTCATVLPETDNYQPRRLFNPSPPKLEPSMSLGHDDSTPIKHKRDDGSSVEEEKEEEEEKKEEEEEEEEGDTSDAETITLDPPSIQGYQGSSSTTNKVSTQRPMEQKKEEDFEEREEKPRTPQKNHDLASKVGKDEKSRGKIEEAFLPSIGISVSDLESSTDFSEGEGEEVVGKIPSSLGVKRDRNARSPDRVDEPPGAIHPKGKRGKVEEVSPGVRESVEEEREEGKRKEKEKEEKPRRRSARLSKASALPTPLNTGDALSEISPTKISSPTRSSDRLEEKRMTRDGTEGERMLLLSEGDEHE
ncbi:MAG: hypothetical protein DHS80DRAFT_23511 [Piptocephalis tieghemiana]|nr:MAG: hypothetical protein DHS80DRAFT_23511 [Piptocephalis tieghemiana]